MKEKDDDKGLRKLLKETAYEGVDNPWLRKKVLNRLPANTNRYKSVEWMLYGVASMLCIIMCVVYVKTSSFEVVTVRDVLTMSVMLVVTIVVVFQTIRSVVSSD